MVASCGPRVSDGLSDSLVWSSDVEAPHHMKATHGTVQDLMTDPKRLKASPWPQALLAVEERRASAAPRLQQRRQIAVNDFIPVSQSTVIAAEAQVNRWCNALERLAWLGSRRLQSNAVATTAAAHAIGGATWPLAAFLLAAQQGDVGAQNAKMALWADGAWSQALEVYDSLTQRRLTPDPTSTSTAIMAAAEELWIVELQCSTILFNSAITACGRCAQWATALAIFTDHFTESLEKQESAWCKYRSNATYTTLPRGFRSLLLAVLVVDYSSLVMRTEKGKGRGRGLLFEARRLRDGRSLGAGLGGSGFVAERAEVTFNAALGACGQCAQWQVALQLMEDRDMGKASFPCDTIAHNTAMAALAKAGRWQHALWLLSSLTSGGADVISYATANDPNGNCSGGSDFFVLGMFKVELDIVAHWGVLDACAGRWAVAGEILAEMYKVGLVHFSAAPVASLAAFDRFAINLVDQIRARTMQLTPVVCDAAMVACESSGELDHLWLLLVSSERSPSAFLWGLALLGTSEAEVIQATEYARPYASVRVETQHADTRCLGELTAEMEDFSLEELVTAVWGVGSVAAQRRVLDVLRGLLDTRRGRPGRPGTLEKASWSPSPSFQDSKPVLVMRDSDRAVLLKPAGWEVYGQHTKRQLSSFAADVLGSRPIFEDPGHYHGFLHRLDVPSSGLILVAASYEAYYDLQVQLHSGQVQRDYTVLHHGRLPVSVNQVDSRLHWHGDGPTLAGGRGKPSRTLVVLQWYAESEVGSVSQSHLQICTGRKHQIRSHLAHIGHPVVRDGAYASFFTSCGDAAICARHWLHRHRLGFRDRTARLREIREAFATLSQALPFDLRESLGRLRHVVESKAQGQKIKGEKKPSSSSLPGPFRAAWPAQDPFAAHREPGGRNLRAMAEPEAKRQKTDAPEEEA
ncbi:hypothetical protein AK812_SmicGene765 [Symbiodinium microadriaticum]|uniref:Pseudouridine synthase RsuA/RluA-like domain-containing protein n=1 Tax=Symbiodinium microadriaticum TaxID=2951 RepID=A0A1Q9F5S7_SYMMI|nr:hypothetical protein AK812_SmicGene765 [Symbiodinium microadriaticum]